MNLGVEDACDLAHRLVHGGLANYSKVRHKKGAAVIKLVKRQNMLFTSSRAWPRFLVRRVLPLLLKIPALKKRLLRVMAGLG